MKLSDSTISRATWSLQDLMTSDGHRLTAVFSCSLSILTEPAEQKFFQEIFSAPVDRVTFPQILAHFQPGFQSTAARLAALSPAALSLDPASQSKWIDALRTAGNAVAFSCGVALLAPFSIEITSPSLQNEKKDQLQRDLAQRASVNRLEHFQRAADLLKQWESLKISSPAITPGQVLEQLNPTDRGPMLETLLMASARQWAQPDLWAVSGSHLIRISLQSETIESQLFPLPATVGPLRSVRIFPNQILIGAQSGLISLDPDQLAAPTIYFAPGLNSDHGFTHPISISTGLFACHRDAGLVHWQTTQFDRPTRTISLPELGGSPKFLTPTSDASLLCAVDDRLVKINPSNEPLTIAKYGSAIVSILSAADQFIVVTEDGKVRFLAAATLEKMSESHPVSRVTGAALLPWLTTTRILLNTTDGSIRCVGLDDQLITQFCSSDIGVRGVASSSGKIAAMSSDRQRIIFWNPWDGRQPAGEIHLTSLTRHRIADIAFG